MENKTKRPARKRLYIICGAAAGCILACALLFKLYMLVPSNKVHAQYDEYQREINKLCDNKITGFTLDSGGDWDPYSAHIVLITKNNYELHATLLNSCDNFGLSGCGSIDGSTIVIGGIMNTGSKKQYELSYVILEGKGREVTYKNNKIDATFIVKDFKDFIMKSDAIIDVLVKKMEAIDKAP